MRKGKSMWHRSKSDRHRGVANRSAKSHWTQRPRRRLCGLVAVAALPFAAGCSPELYALSAIVVPLAYRHMNQGGPGSRPNAVQMRTDRPRIHTQPVHTGIVHAAHDTRQPQEPRSQGPQPATPSLVTQGALAYREMRWEDAKRFLTQSDRRSNVYRLCIELCTCPSGGH